MQAGIAFQASSVKVQTHGVLYARLGDARLQQLCSFLKTKSTNSQISRMTETAPLGKVWKKRNILSSSKVLSALNGVPEWSSVAVFKVEKNKINPSSPPSPCSGNTSPYRDWMHETTNRLHIFHGPMEDDCTVRYMQRRCKSSILWAPIYKNVTTLRCCSV